MEDMQTQMGAILNNPDMMQKIMAMAQSLNATESKEEPSPPQKDVSQVPPFPIPDIDPGMLQKLSGIATNSGVDPHQKNLLQALSPYLSNQRILKLEKAMRAAKMAKLASAFLGQSGNLFGVGR